MNRRPLVQRLPPATESFRGCFYFDTERENSMSAQVVKVLHLNGILSAWATQNRRLSQNFFHIIRAPFRADHILPKCTRTGKPDNEFKQYGRHRRRLSKNTWALHCPHKRTGARLRTLVPDP